MTQPLDTTFTAVSNLTSPKTVYPLLTVFFSIVLLSYFYVQTQADLIGFYHVPVWVFDTTTSQLLLGAFAIIILLELRYIQRRRQHQRSQFKQLHDQINELLSNKKQLHTQAHVYANHADKLKLFISDKLLEYIEYDEKFLHFKSIASEVRHNGVISYDIVTTALTQQLSTIDNTDSIEYTQTIAARDSLRYLWDLLDLSTADNIALHIANQVCENEELLFQSELGSQALSALPEKPIFNASDALKKALDRCFGSEPIAQPEGRLKIVDQDHVFIQLKPTGELLGNENHIILALENVINNAQFFAGRHRSRRTEKRAGISVECEQQGDYIDYRVYNRGQHIDEDSSAKLFQLGYSTRRAKEHHGKGLGLYFVKEIIKGYDGKIEFSNIRNHLDIVSLRLKMANGDVITEVIELVVEDDKPLCRKSGDDEAIDSLEWQLPSELVSIEITHQSDQKTHRRVDAALEEGLVLDPSQTAHPRWRLTIDHKRQAPTLVFKPLDITGVQFTIKLPSLAARLEGNHLNADTTDMERQVADISSRFQVLEQ